MIRSIHQATSPAETLRQAVGLHQSGRIDEAASLYRIVLKLLPKNATALHLLGVCHRQQGDSEAAVRLIRKALAIDPRLAGAWNNLGVAYSEQCRWNDAVTSFGRALALNRDAADPYYNRANALEALHRFDDALADHDRALALRPDYTAALNNRGNVLLRLGRYSEALETFDRALAIWPDYAAALNNRGTAFQELNRLDEAIRDYDRAIALQPDYADAWFSRSLCHLLLGNYRAGWMQYEWRWQVRDSRAKQRSFERPLWLGETDIVAKSILIHAEQGLGDTLQFCRYLPVLAGRGATVLLEAQPELKSVLSGLAGVSRFLARGEALPEFDCHCPLLSLPLALGADLTDIPAEVPYLRCDEQRVAQWRQRLGPKTGTLRIGLVWSGSPQHKNDHNRSLPLTLLQDCLADVPAEIYSLQKVVRDADRNILPGCAWLRQHKPPLGDFADTAALVSQLDLVISVDTAVAHLAGALGKSVWLLLPFSPDWRWMLARPDSPWYPTARLFRQTAPGDWQSVLAEVRGALQALIAEYAR